MACWIVRCLALVIIVAVVSQVAGDMTASSRCGVVVAAFCAAEVACAVLTRSGLVARLARARS